MRSDLAFFYRDSLERAMISAVIKDVSERATITRKAAPDSESGSARGYGSSQRRSHECQLVQLISSLMQFCGSHGLAIDEINRWVLTATNHFFFALVGLIGITTGPPDPKAVSLTARNT